MEEAHKWQVKYYIFYLKNKGIKVLKGIIHYPKIFRKIEVNLNKKDENLIKDKLIFIKNFLKNPKPPPVERKKYCKKCAYFEFCFIYNKLSSCKTNILDSHIIQHIFYNIQLCNTRKR